MEEGEFRWLIYKELSVLIKVVSDILWREIQLWEYDLNVRFLSMDAYTQNIALVWMWRGKFSCYNDFVGVDFFT